jgi:hypothetical protein
MVTGIVAKRSGCLDDYAKEKFHLFAATRNCVEVVIMETSIHLLRFTDLLLVAAYYYSIVY